MNVEWCNGSTTDFGSVCSGSSPDSITTHLYQLNNMSYLKSYVATATISPEDMGELLRELFDNPVKSLKRTRVFSHPALVKVKSGDGVGFDVGHCIAVTNAKNNVGMLLKANYKEPFEKHESLNVSKQGISNVKDLVPGHTYIIYDGNSFAFVKYLGHSMILVRCQNSYDIMRVEGNRIPLHYELSIPAEK